MQYAPPDFFVPVPHLQSLGLVYPALTLLLDGLLAMSVLRVTIVLRLLERRSCLASLGLTLLVGRAIARSVQPVTPVISMAVR